MIRLDTFSWFRGAVRRVLAGLLAVGLLGLGGCAHRGPAAHANTSVARLTADLAALGPDVDPNEAGAVAEFANAAADELRREYRMVWPPWLHNFLVNHKMRTRGLCFQWADDMHARLRPLDLRTLELGFAVARQRTIREHSSVTVRARGEPLRDAIVIDPWRKSGRLFWARLSEDRYPWQPVTPAGARRKR